MKKLKLGLLSAIMMFATATSAQITDEKVLEHIGGSVETRTAHLWRGYEVGSEVNVATDLHVKTKDGSFKVGVWGGYGINGNFKEFDYYMSYTAGGLTLALWDIYNYSPGASYNNREAFNYKARETGHFIDASLSYTFPKSFPLTVYYSTVIFGRDRGADNDSNKYSTFVQLGYPIVDVNGFKVDASVGGAFSYKTKQHFYGNTGGIVDARLRVSKDIKLGNYTLPVYIMPMWNPQANKMYMQVGATLFKL